MGLFRRAAIATDIHFGLKSNSIIHNQDCENFIKWFISVAKENKCETCFFLGDWHHHRASINIQTLNYSLRSLELLNNNFDQVFFIPGNHDLYYRDRRDIHSVEWAKHLSNITIIDNWYHKDDVTIAPWLINDDWKQLQKFNGKYLFGHFELPNFFMNAKVEMPNHGEIQLDHLSGFEKVFSGHFHKRQIKNNITYVGNAFPHNYSDAFDDDRGMMILEWDKKPKFYAWPEQPKFRVYKLSDVLDDPDTLLFKNLNVRINLDIDISYEESSYIKETLMPKYQLREMSLVPIKFDYDIDGMETPDLHTESVDNIIINQIDQLQQGNFDKQLLLSIYKNL